MMLGIAECNRQHSILYLHEIEKSLVQADIELYLKDELKHMLPAHCNEIEELAEQAGNLFIYAATAVRYIQDRKAVNPRQRLKTILEVDKRSQKSMFGIDVLYSTILSAAVHDATLEPEEQACIQVVLRTSVCACEPVLISTLAALSGLDETHLAASALEPLRSVLHISEHNSFVTTLHASFPDFMFSQERSQEYFCDRTVHDQFLAARCLEIMRAQLRFNICGLESSFALDNEIPNLDDQVKAHVSPELCYTGRFWADHLTQGAATDELLNAVEDFLSYRLLFWMEVMNLTKSMIAASVAATKVHVWLRSSSASSDVISLARDAQTFVGKYASHPVSTSTPHIYISALPLISSKNLIRSTYMPRFTGLVKATGTYLDRTEEASLETWTVSQSQLRSVSFSTDCKRIVIGGNNGRIYVKNTQNGEDITDFKAHRKAISSVAFSLNGDLVASSSHDHTLCLWRVSDGSRVSVPFTGHSSRVNSVAFSPDSMRMVSGSEDATIRIWSTHSPSNSKIMTASGAVRSVIFSHDSLLVASGSSDHNVYLWDALNGTLLRTLLGHTQSVGCARFSPCGKYISSGSNDGTIRSWCAHDGAPTGSPLKGHTKHITSLAVSPEGERIVSGSLDKTVRVWHRASGDLMAGPFEGHSAPVRSVEFSADGARIISASDDGTIRVWNAQGKRKDVTMSDPFEDTYSSRIVYATISPTGACVACESANGTITLWKLSNDGVELAWTLPYAAGGAVRCIVFSTDLDQIFVAYFNGTMCTVGTGTGRFVGEPYRYSTSYHGTEMVRLSSDGRSAVSSWGGRNEIDIWDLQRNRWVRRIGSEDSKFVDIKLQSNTAWFATVNSKGTINLWDRFTGNPLSSFGCQGGIERICIGVSPNGTHIIYPSGPDHFSAYDTLSGTHTELRSFFKSKGYIEAVLPNEIYLCTYNLFTSSARIILYDYKREETIDEVALSERSGPMTSLALVTNKTALVSLCYDGICQVTWIGVERTSLRGMTEAGWALDKNNHKTIWVPPEIREFFLLDSGCRIANEGCINIALGYDNMLIGKRWKECYIGPVDGCRGKYSLCLPDQPSYQCSVKLD
ncbi:Vegetative incompatibility protein HET-E-1 OS=Podospora anserina GN=HET-E1 PE=4 SV=1 [Rhizoctonia solani AG-1 IB]|uniref:Vegetative incompatibility protein HET-E-1 n=1 Tax=Thanatephorus cucumeris (strain AG1-IB / isolate 7/3/14) TaxID=1108050 RepID=A0A0B7FVN2_THACB|nr:Vegetative incompatibility protein HET-E-1 OS=Podospora anserina GN=HET-E1 PE=4 SV=1 [Rhizoctonia solani AG-1 IB]